MPNVVLKSVESFSSEDANYPASNLLAKEVRKWKCREPGEKSAYVVLRLEQPVVINGIDIGNEHSAFVEVLVAKSGPANPEFKEILLTSSFMTPIESRNSTSTNRVRCFIQGALVESTAKDKWDLVKIVCTQPFNSRVQYGIACISLHSPSTGKKDKPLVPEKFQRQIEEAAKKQEALKAEVKQQESPKAMKLGRFTIREESPDSDEGDTSATNLFARWKESRTGLSTPKPTGSPSVSTAAAIRDAAKTKQQSPSVKKPITPKAKPRLFDDDEDGEVAKPIKRNRESLLYDKEDDKPNEKLEKKMAEDRARQQKEADAKKEKEKRDRLLQEKKENLHDTSATKFKDFLFDEPPVSKATSPEKKPKPKESKPSTPSASDKNERNKHDSNGDKDRERKALSVEKEHKKRPSESSSTKNHTPTRSEQEESASKKRKLQRDKDSDEERKKRKPVTYKPFNKLLENVVLVISGIQNPERGNLRNQALAMGAKYKSDWDSSCTHLICAFKNTPKYNQVRGSGKIVKKEWIERCHALRKRLSWRKFALDSSDAEQTDSEGEIVDIARKPNETAPGGGESSQHATKDVDMKEARASPEKETDEEALAHYDLDDVVEVEQSKPETVEVSGSDTEEEIERVKNNQKAKLEKDTSEIYDKSTDDEGLSKSADQFAPLDFFKGKVFFIDADVGAVDVIKLERYVNLYKGTVTKTAKEADYVVTRTHKPMPESFKGELIKPLWVYECHDMECLIPTQRYRP